MTGAPLRRKVTMNLLHTKWDEHSRDRQNRLLTLLVLSPVVVALVARLAG